VEAETADAKLKVSNMEANGRHVRKLYLAARNDKFSVIAGA
jgi:hypothetical protein